MQKLLRKIWGAAGDLGDTIEESIAGIPLIGGTLVDKLGLKDLGEQFQNLFADTLKGGVAPIGSILNGTCRNSCGVCRYIVGD